MVPGATPPLRRDHWIPNPRRWMWKFVESSVFNGVMNLAIVASLLMIPMAAETEALVGAQGVYDLGIYFCYLFTAEVSGSETNNKSKRASRSSRRSSPLHTPRREA